MPSLCVRCGRGATCVSVKGLQDAGWTAVPDGWLCLDCQPEPIAGWLDEAGVRERIRRLEMKIGGVRALAASLKLSPSYVSDFLNGRRGPGKTILKVLGLKSKLVYVPEES